MLSGLLSGWSVAEGARLLLALGHPGTQLEDLGICCFAAH